MRLLCLLSVAVVFASGCASTKTEKTTGAARAFTVRRDFVYTPADWPRALQADLYQPEGAGPFPGVVLIYGGSWSSGDNRWHMRLLARKLARQGFVVLSPTYRGAPEFRYPAPVDDLRAAVRWLRVNASELRLASDKIAAYGFSAGGHLAGLLATLDGPPAVRVQALVAASAPADLSLYPGGKVLPRFLGATFAERPDLFRAASPVTHVSPDDPPVFLYHGTADRTVAPEHSRVFKTALDRAGVRNELRWAEGRGHASMLLLEGSSEDAAIAFLKATLR